MTADRTAALLEVDRALVDKVRKLHQESHEQRDGPPSLDPPTARP
jgi:hypothetical protein